MKDIKIDWIAFIAVTVAFFIFKILGVETNQAILFILLGNSFIREKE